MRWPGWIAMNVLALVALSDCLDPTEIVVQLRTDVACSVVDVNGVSITVGQPGDDDAGVVTVSRSCDDAGSIGSLVVTPSNDIREDVGLRVTLGVNVRAEQCAGPKYTGCIVARRSLRYSPHTPLTLPIDLDQSCLDKECDPSSTCVNGACVDAGIGACPNNQCTIDAGPPPPVDAGCDSGSVFITQDALARTPHIAKTSSGYAIAWVTTSNQVYGATLSASGTMLTSPVPLALLPNGGKFDALGSDGTNYFPVWEDTNGTTMHSVDTQGVMGPNVFLTGNIGPVGGVFFEPTPRLYTLVTASTGGTQLISAGPPTFNATPLLPTTELGMSLARTGSTYYAAMHDGNGCTLFTCAFNPGGTFTCQGSMPVPACGALRAAVGPSGLALAFLKSGSLDVIVQSQAHVASPAIDDVAAFIPLATGATPFRLVWRAGDMLQTNTYPNVAAIPTTLEGAMAYTTSGGVGAGFDAVEDDAVASTGYAYVYWKAGGGGGTSGIHFAHACQ